MIFMADDNNKFILIGLEDAGDVAEALKNKTCKKLLNYLAEIKEASEKDISDALKIPINTVEYNLKKLIKSGLVDKTKNFFWSVKGKKIPMYKLVRKHIIISPSKNPSLSYIKSILPVVLISAILVVILSGIYLFPKQNIISEQDKINQFQSQEELNNFIKQSQELNEHLSYSGGFLDRVSGVLKAGTSVSFAETSSGTSPSASDYSTTNIQVEGVDESDIIKNDGKYIYVVNGNKVKIIDAYPAENMNILSEITFSETNINIGNIFINDNKLIVFASSYGYGESLTLVYIYDMSDKQNPKLENNLSYQGNYVDSRMINDYVYVISNKYINTENPEPPIYAMNGVVEKVSANNIYYYPHPDIGYVFTSVSAINVKDGKFNNKVYLTSYAGTIYVSQDNIYLTYQKRVDYKDYAEKLAEEIYYPILPNEYDSKIKDILDSDKNSWEKLNEMQKIVSDYSQSLIGEEKSDFDKELLEGMEDFEIKVQKETEKTVVHKINVDKDNIEYKGVGEVPGHILNQFSMDEFNGYFRIATTTGDVWGGNSLNHIYVLNENLEIVGKIEDLAKGEKIYSARFLGERVYMVTFKKVDPLFVICLKNPEKPEVLGYLKIPGYSDYLHPYDENHVIGIGKEAIDASESQTSARNLDFAWYQGVKIALFDVSDVQNPIEESKFVIGDRGTDSSALYEHKAFLFNKEKNLLVIPITLAEIDRSKYRQCSEEELKDYESYSYCLTDNTYGKQVWQGAYVLNINDKEISLRGKISHQDDFTKTEYGSVKMDYDKQIQRSLFMDNVLYTISNSKIKSNDLGTVDEINSLDLGYKQDSQVYYAE